MPPYATTMAVNAAADGTRSVLDDLLQLGLMHHRDAPDVVRAPEVLLPAAAAHTQQSRRVRFWRPTVRNVPATGRQSFASRHTSLRAGPLPEFRALHLQSSLAACDADDGRPHAPRARVRA
jgi:hypothetical protein